ncbi:Protein of unknown function [Pseudovibrio sp. Tun.PSC04-5.I4]|nr:Protein of unknown function [Pseudovibrio sp. Tun.PSC04-5.I4]
MLLDLLTKSYRGELHFVTAVNSNFLEKLEQLISSIRRFEPTSRITTYDLGLSEEEKHKLVGLVDSVEAFNFANYSDYFDINVNAGEYAWKAVIINRELEKSGTPICWMDSRNILTGRQNVIRRSLGARGYYFTGSNGNIEKWTHPSMIEYLGLDLAVIGQKRNINACALAFDPNCDPARSLVREWAQLSQVKNCIAPEGSSRENHRQDQSLITVLAYSRDLLKKPNKNRNFLIHQ